MNQKEITLLMAYIYNNTDRLEYEVKQLQSNVRFRNIDSSDCMELIKSTIYLEAFKEITTHIRCLLSLYPDEKEKTGD
ncbi:MAG: hypothetical protein K2K14_08365 [Ruminococcus sp.]|nr:hypothetical protein [Ruminococcus sp.]